MPTVTVIADAAEQEFKRGDAIIYMPPEANDNPASKAALHGVVQMTAGAIVWCRFYYRGTRIWWTAKDAAVPVAAAQLVRRKGWKAVVKKD